MIAKKRIAAIVTEYRKISHADVILGKILDGYFGDGKEMPAVELVSVYVDQFPKNDLGRDLAKKHGFRIAHSIESALTDGTKKLVVDGVLSIGEHGDYPNNAKGQKLYPRRRFFEGILKAFDKCDAVVPVFNDKHLAAEWDDAKWMYDQARKRMIPFFAGSTVPIAWRKPDLVMPKDAGIVAAVQLGHGPLEAYGFHTLEGLQCMMERRAGGETGVRAVTALRGAAMWDAFDAGKYSQECLDAGVKLIGAKGEIRELTAKAKDAAIFFVEYLDGVKAAVAILNGIRAGDAAAFCFAGLVKGGKEPITTQFVLQNSPPYAHFGLLVRAFEKMLQTYHAPYPVERTLLTTGILAAAMTSLHEGGKRIETPELKIAYKPSDWPHAPPPIPDSLKNR